MRGLWSVRRRGGGEAARRDERWRARAGLVAAVAALALAGAPAHAQAPSSPGDAPAGATDAPPEEGETGKTAQEPAEPVAPADRFNPSERVPAGASVSFPVDI